MFLFLVFLAKKTAKVIKDEFSQSDENEMSAVYVVDKSSSLLKLILRCDDWEQFMILTQLIISENIWENLCFPSNEAVNFIALQTQHAMFKSQTS